MAVPVPAVHHIFDIGSVEASISKTLAAVPPDHTWVVLGHAEKSLDGTTIAAVAFAVRKGPLQWQVQASVSNLDPFKVETNLIISG